MEMETGMLSICIVEKESGLNPKKTWNQTAAPEEREMETAILNTLRRLKVTRSYDTCDETIQREARHIIVILIAGLFSAKSTSNQTAAPEAGDTSSRIYIVHIYIYIYYN